MPTMESVLDDALRLSDDDRVRLVERLQASVQVDPKIEAAWKVEIQRRIDAIAAGEPTIPAEKVFADILARRPELAR